MKRIFTPLALCLALSAGNLLARESTAPPPPSTSDSSTGALTPGPDGTTLFVGHFGETLVVHYGWTAKAEIRGVAEIVHIHRKSHDDFGLRPFQPKPSDFKLENFAPMGLMELVVVPKNAPGGLRTLAELRAAKEKELNSIQAAFRIDDPRESEAFRRCAAAPYRGEFSDSPRSPCLSCHNRYPPESLFSSGLASWR